MPPKYSHVKKRSAAGLLKPGASTPSNLIKETYDPHSQQPQYQQHIQLNTNHFPIIGIQPNSFLPNISKELSQAMAAVAHLERSIARLLLLRFEWDMARLYSTRLYVLAITAVPVLVAKLTEQGGPGWVAMNSESEEVKDYFRSVIAMDMREAGERVATKSVLWSYTALRRFALSHNVPISPDRGLHSLRLLPFFPDLKAHVDWLEAQPPPVFEKPAFFGGLEQGYRILEEACVEMGLDLGIEVGTHYDLTIPSTVSVLHEGQQFPPAGGSSLSGTTTAEMLRSSMAENPELANAAITYTLTPAAETRLKLRLGYTRLVQTMWKVAREFDVRGYGQVLRDKLTVKWCECGCSTEHLGEVCEKTVREEEEAREQHNDGIWGGGDITVEAYGPFIVDDKWGDLAKGKTSETPGGLPALQNKDTNSTSKSSGKSSGKKKAAPPQQSVDEEAKQARFAELKKLVWDGRGSGVYAWETYNEEDIWEVELDFGTGKRRKKAPELSIEDAQPFIPGWRLPRSFKRKQKLNQKAAAVFLEDLPLPSVAQGNTSQPGKNPFEEEEAQMTIGEMMEWRFIKAEKRKDLGNNAFSNGRYAEAIAYYRQAQEIEPELPHYHLNLAAAHLKLNQWMDAEKACTRALSQTRSSKGLFRRAKARQMQGKIKEAIEDYRALIRLQPWNTNAMIDLLCVLHRPLEGRPPDSAISPEDNPWKVNLKPETDAEIDALYKKLGMTKPKRQKPIPFQRTKADDAVLRIFPVDPRGELGGSAEATSATGVDGTECEGCSTVVVEEGAREDELDAFISGAKGKLKSGKARGKEKKEDLGRSGLLRSGAAEYGVSYFTWDRYVVQRVES